jgi:spore germination protein GerM
MGKQKDHLRRPFADPKALALKEYLLSRGLDEKLYPNFFKLMDAYLKASEQKTVSEMSEEAKVNLAIATGLEEDVTKRPPIFEI